jgi:hypothetical protein
MSYDLYRLWTNTSGNKPYLDFDRTAEQVDLSRRLSTVRQKNNNGGFVIARLYQENGELLYAPAIDGVSTHLIRADYSPWFELADLAKLTIADFAELTPSISNKVLIPPRPNVVALSFINNRLIFGAQLLKRVN